MNIAPHLHMACTLIPAVSLALRRPWRLFGASTRPSGAHRRVTAATSPPCPHPGHQQTIARAGQPYQPRIRFSHGLSIAHHRRRSGRVHVLHFAPLYLIPAPVVRRTVHHSTPGGSAHHSSQTFLDATSHAASTRPRARASHPPCRAIKAYVLEPMAATRTRIAH